MELTQGEHPRGSWSSEGGQTLRHLQLGLEPFSETNQLQGPEPGRRRVSEPSLQVLSTRALQTLKPYMYMSSLHILSLIHSTYIY